MGWGGGERVIAGFAGTVEGASDSEVSGFFFLKSTRTTRLNSYQDISKLNILRTPATPRPQGISDDRSEGEGAEMGRRGTMWLRCVAEISDEMVLMNVFSGMVKRTIKEAMKRTLTGSLGHWWIGWTGLRMMLERGCSGTIRGRWHEQRNPPKQIGYLQGGVAEVEEVFKLGQEDGIDERDADTKTAGKGFIMIRRLNRLATMDAKGTSWKTDEDR